MMLLDKLNSYRVVLASQSPRRRELLGGLGISFEVCRCNEPEAVSPEWTPEEIVRQLSMQKAQFVFSKLSNSPALSQHGCLSNFPASSLQGNACSSPDLPQQRNACKFPDPLQHGCISSSPDLPQQCENLLPLLVIGGDTIVVAPNGQVLGKPKSRKEASYMLNSLSGKTHIVHSGICVITEKGQICESDTAEVSFEQLEPDEIDYYIDHFHPFDKAGSYGVQEWLGYRGIGQIKGSFFTVMGLPTHLLWKMLVNMQ